MNCDFQFKLQNTRKNSIRLLANSIVLLNGCVLVYLALTITNITAVLITGCLCGLAVLLDFFFKRKDWLFHTTGIVLALVGWVVLGFWWVGIIMLGLSAFAEIVSANKQICFNTKEIITTTLFGKAYQWNSLQNVVLKDGLLTMDFKNNKLLQVLINQEINPEQEQEFNDFCQHCLLKMG